MPLFVSCNFLDLKSVLFDIGIATSALFLVTIFMGYLFSIFSLLTYLCLWIQSDYVVSNIRSDHVFFIRSAILCLLIGEFNLFTLKVILMMNNLFLPFCSFNICLISFLFLNTPKYYLLLCLVIFF